MAVAAAPVSVATIEDERGEVAEVILTFGDGGSQVKFHLREGLLGKGSYGSVYQTKDGRYAVKIVFLPADNEAAAKAFETEAMLQVKLHEKVPEACPGVLGFGKSTKPTRGLDRRVKRVVDGYNHYIVTEKMEGTAFSFIIEDTVDGKHTVNDNVLFARECLRQIATLLQRLEEYQFNHRDLKLDNIMYNRDPATGRLTFKMIDFGFACGTFDGQQYAGSTWFTAPDAACFRKSRDLGSLVLNMLYHRHAVDTRGNIVMQNLLSPHFQGFLSVLLTFPLPDGKMCRIYAGCEGRIGKQWREAYPFFEQAEIENPNTTPEGLLEKLKAYEAKLEADAQAKKGGRTKTRRRKIRTHGRRRGRVSRTNG